MHIQEVILKHSFDPTQHLNGVSFGCSELPNTLQVGWIITQIVQTAQLGLGSEGSALMDSLHISLLQRATILLSCN